MNAVLKQIEIAENVFNTKTSEWDDYSRIVNELANKMEYITSRRDINEALEQITKRLSTHLCAQLQSIRSKLVQNVCSDLIRIVNVTGPDFQCLANALLEAIVSTAKNSSIAIRDPGMKLFSAISEHSRFDIINFRKIFIQVNLIEKSCLLMLTQLEIILKTWKKDELIPNYEDIVDILRRACKNPSVNVREMGRNVLCEFSKQWPDKIPDLVDIVPDGGKMKLIQQQPSADITLSIMEKYPELQERAQHKKEMFKNGSRIRKQSLSLRKSSPSAIAKHNDIEVRVPPNLRRNASANNPTEQPTYTKESGFKTDYSKKTLNTTSDSDIFTDVKLTGKMAFPEPPQRIRSAYTDIWEDDESSRAPLLLSHLTTVGDETPSKTFDQDIPAKPRPPRDEFFKDHPIPSSIEAAPHILRSLDNITVRDRRRRKSTQSLQKSNDIPSISEKVQLDMPNTNMQWGANGTNKSHEVSQENLPLTIENVHDTLQDRSNTSESEVSIYKSDHLHENISVKNTSVDTYSEEHLHNESVRENFDPQSSITTHTTQEAYQSISPLQDKSKLISKPMSVENGNDQSKEKSDSPGQSGGKLSNPNSFEPEEESFDDIVKNLRQRIMFLQDNTNASECSPRSMQHMSSLSTDQRTLKTNENVLNANPESIKYVASNNINEDASGPAVSPTTNMPLSTSNAINTRNLQESKHSEHTRRNHTTYIAEEDFAVIPPTLTQERAESQAKSIRKSKGISAPLTPSKIPKPSRLPKLYKNAASNPMQKFSNVSRRNAAINDCQSQSLVSESATQIMASNILSYQKELAAMVDETAQGYKSKVNDHLALDSSQYTSVLEQEKDNQSHSADDELSTAPTSSSSRITSNQPQKKLKRRKPKVSMSDTTLYFSKAMALAVLGAGLLRAANTFRNTVAYHEAIVSRIGRFEANVAESHEMVKHLEEHYTVWSNYIRKLAEEDEQNALSQLEGIQMEVEKWQIDMRNDVAEFQNTLAGYIEDIG